MDRGVEETLGSKEGGEATDVDPLTMAGALDEKAGILMLCAHSASVAGNPSVGGELAMAVNFAKSCAIFVYCSS